MFARTANVHVETTGDSGVSSVHPERRAIDKSPACNHRTELLIPVEMVKDRAKSRSGNPSYVILVGQGDISVSRMQRCCRYSCTLMAPDFSTRTAHDCRGPSNFKVIVPIT